MPGRATTRSRRSATRTAPSTRPTDVPGKLTGRCAEPVRCISSDVLPTFGRPTRATTSSAATVPAGEPDVTTPAPQGRARARPRRGAAPVGSRAARTAADRRRARRSAVRPRRRATVPGRPAAAPGRRRRPRRARARAGGARAGPGWARWGSACVVGVLSAAAAGLVETRSQKRRGIMARPRWPRKGSSGRGAAHAERPGPRSRQSAGDIGRSPPILAPRAPPPSEPARRHPPCPPPPATVVGVAACRGTARRAAVRPRPAHRGHRAAAPRRPAPPGARAQRAALPSVRVAVDRLVHARGLDRLRDPVLPRAPAAGAARARADARGRGQHARAVHEAAAARGRPRARQRLPPAPAHRLARDVRQLQRAVPARLPCAPEQQGPRAASRLLVRAESSGRGLRRDVRGVALFLVALAGDLRRLAGAEETRARRPDARRRRRAAAARALARPFRLAADAALHAARVLPAQAGELWLPAAVDARPRAALAVRRARPRRRRRARVDVPARRAARTTRARVGADRPL